MSRGLIMVVVLYLGPCHVRTLFIQILAHQVYLGCPRDLHSHDFKQMHSALLITSPHIYQVVIFQVVILVGFKKYAGRPHKMQRVCQSQC
jgi:hypothetical protein